MVERGAITIEGLDADRIHSVLNPLTAVWPAIVERPRAAIPFRITKKAIRGRILILIADNIATFVAHNEIYPGNLSIRVHCGGGDGKWAADGVGRQSRLNERAIPSAEGLRWALYARFGIWWHHLITEAQVKVVAMIVLIIETAREVQAKPSYTQRIEPPALSGEAAVGQIEASDQRHIGSVIDHPAITNVIAEIP